MYNAAAHRVNCARRRPPAGWPRRRASTSRRLLAAGSGTAGAILYADVEAAAGGAPAPVVPVAGKKAEAGQSGPRRECVTPSPPQWRGRSEKFRTITCNRRIDMHGRYRNGWLEFQRRSTTGGAAAGRRAVNQGGGGGAAPLPRAERVLSRDGAFQPSARQSMWALLSPSAAAGLVAPAIHDTDQLLAGGPDGRNCATSPERVRAGRFRGSEIAGSRPSPYPALANAASSTLYGVIYPPQVALVGSRQRGRATAGSVERRRSPHAITCHGDAIRRPSGERRSSWSSCFCGRLALYCRNRRRYDRR